MSKPRAKVVRTQSTPVMIPGNKKRIEALRKLSVGTPTKSILKTSLASSPASEVGSSPCGTPDLASSGPKRKISVRFSERNIESPDYYLYNKHRSGQAIVNPMAVFRKISLDKEFTDRNRDDDSDSVKCVEGSDDELDDDFNDELQFDRGNDDDTVRSNSPPLRLSSSMSTEAQYAILKAYEDEMYEKIAETFPDVCERLEANRCQTPDVRNQHDSDDISLALAEMDGNVSNFSSVCCDPYKVAQRIQRAMDILDSVRETNGELITSNRCGNRTIAKNPVKSFEKWSQSLKNVIDKVDQIKV